jgi:HPt (histidine-containing phosphotransfer) domain-containing protein
MTELLDLATLTELERRLGRERIMRVVAAQVANAKELAKRLIELEAAPDVAQIKALAHQIAGSSGSIGLLRLSDTAVALETEATRLDLPNLRSHVRDLRNCLEASEATLRHQFPEIADP